MTGGSPSHDGMTKPPVIVSARKPKPGHAASDHLTAVTSVHQPNSCMSTYACDMMLRSVFSPTLLSISISEIPTVG